MIRESWQDIECGTTDLNYLFHFYEVEWRTAIYMVHENYLDIINPNLYSILKVLDGAKDSINAVLQ